MLNIAISSSEEDTNLVIRVAEGEASRTFLRGALSELRNDEERKCVADILAAVNAFVLLQQE